MKTFYKVLHRSTHLCQGFGGKAKSKARLGEIKTDHGLIKTPAFISAATKGTIKSLSPQLIKEIGIQAGCVNTYHLVIHPGAEIIEKAGGIYKYGKLEIPLMSDSGGFQVFSLAKDEKARHRNFLTPLEPPRSREVQSRKKFGISLSQNNTRTADVRGEEQPLLVKIYEDGVKFRSTFDGTLIEFTPEKSMEYQRQIGADINMAFDECTYYPASHEYTEKAMKRTHKWLIRSIKKFKGLRVKRVDELKNLRNSQNSQNIFNNQYLYGVIQGGIFENLRKKSAEFVVSQDTPGVAIGGVSVGESKKEMRDQVRWVSDYLPKDRPVHLLGVGQIDDIIDLVKYGVDTFDCVEPTRLARMGRIYQITRLNSVNKSSLSNFYEKLKNRKNHSASLSGQTDILKSIYKADLSPVNENCQCYVCQNFTKSYLHHLFKQREILGYTLATYHNLWTMEKLFEKIREMIGNDLI